MLCHLIGPANNNQLSGKGLWLLGLPKGFANYSNCFLMIGFDITKILDQMATLGLPFNIHWIKDFAITIANIRITGIPHYFMQKSISEPKSALIKIAC